MKTECLFLFEHRIRLGGEMMEENATLAVAGFLILLCVLKDVNTFGKKNNIQYLKNKNLQTAGFFN